MKSHFRTSILRRPGHFILYRTGDHKPYALVRFPGSGTVYQVQKNGGTLRRIS